MKKNLQLESQLWSLRLDYENAVEDCHTANLTIKSLEALPALKLECQEALQKELFEKNDAINSIRIEIHQLAKEKDDQGNKIKSQNREIKDLELSSRNAKHASDKLNKELCETKTKFQEEKATISKLHKA